ncbi:hypothetical protein NIES806_03230 [Dolichospermum compactum NIES-806]|uniref:Uncharacterized protein n=1 Tax=Dolichospermum compactum NIES-806 TaxID=1973481 RepID=A0A1Z4UY03_9CYAN|nr:hypothetical protein NIES806_03230 [Dolichospermum compactum NIES-806]
MYMYIKLPEIPNQNFNFKMINSQAFLIGWEEYTWEEQPGRLKHSLCFSIFYPGQPSFFVPLV